MPNEDACPGERVVKNQRTTEPSCAHAFTVETMAHLVPGGMSHRLSICQACHRVSGRFTTFRWKMQDDKPAVGAHLAPWMWDAGAASCFKVPAFLGDRDPPMLIPTVDPGELPFVRDVQIGDRVAVLASIGLLQWIEGRVVFVGDNLAGVRGIVTTTTQGLTLRGNERTIAGIGAVWGLTFLGEENQLDKILALHREAFPIAA